MDIYKRIEGIIFVLFIISSIVIGCVSAETQERDRKEWARIDRQFAQSKIKRKMKEPEVIDDRFDFDIILDQETALPIEVLKSFDSKLDPRIILGEWTQLILILSSKDTITSYFGNPKINWEGVDPKDINIENHPVPEGDVSSFASVTILLTPDKKKGRLINYGYFNKEKEMRTFRFEGTSYKYFDPKPFIKQIIRNKAKSKGGLDT